MTPSLNDRRSTRLSALRQKLTSARTLYSPQANFAETVTAILAVKNSTKRRAAWSPAWAMKAGRAGPPLAAHGPALGILASSLLTVHLLSCPCPHQAVQ